LSEEMRFQFLPESVRVTDCRRTEPLHVRVWRNRCRPCSARNTVSTNQQLATRELEVTSAEGRHRGSDFVGGSTAYNGSPSHLHASFSTSLPPPPMAARRRFTGPRPRAQAPRRADRCPFPPRQPRAVTRVRHSTVPALLGRPHYR